MRSNCGWGQLIDPGSEAPVARGRVFVSACAEAIVTREQRCDWQGEIDLLRAGKRPLTDGIYTLWFEDGHEQRLVHVGDVAAQAAPSGARGLARLSSADSEAPSLMTELGGEE
jgi:hypothetical protein